MGSDKTLEIRTTCVYSVGRVEIGRPEVTTDEQVLESQYVNHMEVEPELGSSHNENR